MPTTLQLANRNQRWAACRIISAVVGAYVLANPSIIHDGTVDRQQVDHLLDTCEARFIQFRHASNDSASAMGMTLADIQPVLSDCAWLENTAMAGVGLSSQGEPEDLFSGHATIGEKVVNHLQDNTAMQLTITNHSTIIGRTGQVYWQFDSLHASGRASLSIYRNKAELMSTINNRAYSTQANGNPSYKMEYSVLTITRKPCPQSKEVIAETGNMLDAYKNIRMIDAETAHKFDATKSRDELIAFYFQALLNDKSRNEQEAVLFEEAVRKVNPSAKL